MLAPPKMKGERGGRGMQRAKANRRPSDSLLILALVLAGITAIVSGRPEERQLMSGFVDSVRLSMARAEAAPQGSAPPVLVDAVNSRTATFWGG